MNTEVIKELNELMKGLLCDRVVVCLPDYQIVKRDSEIVKGLELQMIAVL